jgi:hypothetical protein
VCTNRSFMVLMSLEKKPIVIVLYLAGLMEPGGAVCGPLILPTCGDPVRSAATPVTAPL